MGVRGRLRQPRERYPQIQYPFRPKRTWGCLGVDLNSSILSQPSEFLRMHTDDFADPSCRIKIKHGTTTLAFRFQGGVIVAVDSRATAGSYVGTYPYSMV